MMYVQEFCGSIVYNRKNQERSPKCPPIEEWTNISNLFMQWNSWEMDSTVINSVESLKYNVKVKTASYKQYTHRQNS